MTARKDQAEQAGAEQEDQARKTAHRDQPEQPQERAEPRSRPIQMCTQTVKQCPTKTGHCLRYDNVPFLTSLDKLIIITNKGAAPETDQAEQEGLDVRTDRAEQHTTKVMSHGDDQHGQETDG